MSPALHSAIMYVYMGQATVITTILVCFILLLRRMRYYHAAKLQHATNLMVDHQNINALVAKTVVLTNARQAEIVQEELHAAADGVLRKLEEDAKLIRQNVVKEALVVHATVVEAVKTVHAEIVAAQKSK